MCVFSEFQLSLDTLVISVHPLRKSAGNEHG